MTMAVDRTIFDEPHYESLELLAATALANRNIGPAFQLADRRCRILPVPEAHCYVLRGEASYQMGARADAIADITKALEIAPDNIAANRRMLAWSNGDQQTKAALTLIDHERDFTSLSRAVQVLFEQGHRNFAGVVVYDHTIEGWTVWDEEADLEISITDGAELVSTKLKPDSRHPLAGYGHAVSFTMRRPKSSRLQSIQLSVAGNIFHVTHAAANAPKPTNGVHRRQRTAADGEPITVIVPVYGDYESTKLCLDALLDALRASPHRAIIVNDATPDPRIGECLAQFAANPAFDMLLNSRNLGFVGSVNRALGHIQDGDVIILNADTIAPQNFIDRLAAAAKSSPDIGTVTPLSNNGEFTSFPIPNMPNPLPSPADIKRIDNIAAQVTADVVDIPSGIGFCLYVTRACLDAVGSLSEEFGRGYLEDADFCLRARERGFRNVCAPSIYVGHAGSKSFGSKRRSLVVRNLGVLEQRFPTHRSECAAFMFADPLRVAREAIEFEAADHASHPRLLVTGAGTVGAVADARARQVVSGREPVFMLKVKHRADGPYVEAMDASGDMPQSLRFDLASSTGCRALLSLLQSVEPTRVEIVDPAHAPFSLVDILLKLGVPCDIFIADAGLLAPEGAQPCVGAVRALATTPNQRRIDAGKIGPAHCSRDWSDFWQEIAAGAQQILAPCAQAQGFAKTVLTDRTIGKIKPSTQCRRMTRRANRAGETNALGFVPVRSCAQEQLLMSELARAFSRIRPDVSILILGSTLNDIDLMRHSNTFVTGAVGPGEFERLFASQGLRRIFISTTRPLFGHPILSAVQSNCLPTAYFDWSMGHSKPDRTDLAIDPTSSLDELVETLSQWMPRA
jgi:GT2 family glycosyltransferase